MKILVLTMMGETKRERVRNIIDAIIEMKSIFLTRFFKCKAILLESLSYYLLIQLSGFTISRFMK